VGLDGTDNPLFPQGRFHARRIQSGFNLFAEVDPMYRRCVSQSRFTRSVKSFAIFLEIMEKKGRNNLIVREIRFEVTNPDKFLGPPYRVLYVPNDPTESQ
jgi:hypothetical protein